MKNKSCIKAKVEASDYCRKKELIPEFKDYKRALSVTEAKRRMKHVLKMRSSNF